MISYSIEWGDNESAFDSEFLSSLTSEYIIMCPVSLYLHLWQIIICTCHQEKTENNNNEEDETKAKKGRYAAANRNYFDDDNNNDDDDDGNDDDDDMQFL